MKIILDGQEVQKFVIDSLPMLIHGIEGSGTSMYTIAIAAKWYNQGYDVLFLCGYPMAEEQFGKFVPSSNAKFFTQDNQEEFKNAFNAADSEKTIILIKNIELFTNDIIDFVSSTKNIVLSGDFNKSNFKEKLLSKRYTTKVYFSNLEGVSLPEMNTYEGFVIADDFKGITKFQP